MATRNLVYIEVRRYSDHGVERRMGQYTEREADKVDGGLNINLDHDRFYTVIVPAYPHRKKSA
jgi:hypothetical protein